MNLKIKNGKKMSNYTDKNIKKPQKLNCGPKHIESNHLIGKNQKYKRRKQTSKEKNEQNIVF